jgi:diacylglycerol kinase
VARQKHPRQTVLHSFANAFAGLGRFSRERNTRIQLAVGVIAIAAGIGFRIDRMEWIAVVLSIGLVLGLEGLNCALERAVDLASPDYHLLARDAKDFAAGAVLVASITALIVGLLIFGPHLTALARPSGSP